MNNLLDWAECQPTEISVLLVL